MIHLAVTIQDNRFTNIVRDFHQVAIISIRIISPGTSILNTCAISLRKHAYTIYLVSLSCKK